MSRKPISQQDLGVIIQYRVSPKQNARQPNQHGGWKGIEDVLLLSRPSRRRCRASSQWRSSKRIRTSRISHSIDQ